MEPTIQWIKEKFGISDEAIAIKQQEEAAVAAAELESKKQSLRDQIQNLTNELDALTAPQQG